MLNNCLTVSDSNRRRKKTDLKQSGSGDVLLETDEDLRAECGDDGETLAARLLLEFRVEPRREARGGDVLERDLRTLRRRGRAPR